jgi:uncharacterized repeat protein (TIGR03803 family)
MKQPILVPNGSTVRWVLSAAVVLTFATTTGASAQKARQTTYAETILHSFTGGAKDGAAAYSPVIVDSAANLYGTTYNGGKAASGTIYTITAAGIENVLSSLGGSSIWPVGGLLMDADGNLYGTGSLGTVFELTAAGKLTVLFEFGSWDDPTGSLVMDATGNLYGTAQISSNSCSCGVVFKLAPPSAGKKKWTQTIIYEFTGKSDGNTPAAGLVFDSAGNLYGTTQYGGKLSACPVPPGFPSPGCGVVFKLTPNVSGTWQESVLYSFTNAPDGAFPQYGSLVMDAQGNLYGTTQAGGAKDRGAVFKVNSSGQESVLYSFTGVSGDGIYPYGGVVLDSLGNLYGTTYQGGTNNYGVVFSVSAGGVETILHSFSGGGTDGAHPSAALVMDGQGNLYGTTEAGGTSGYGIVYKLAP